MKTKLNLWLSRDLTLYEKSLLAKTLGVAQLIYAASMNVIKLVQSHAVVLFFCITTKKIKSTDVMYQPLKHGGANFVNFETVVKSVLLAWISRPLSNTENEWKAIPGHYLSQFGGLSFLLRCDFDPAFRQK